MNKRYLNDKESHLFNEFLNLKDLEKVAKESKFSTSTVHNIIHKRVMINSRTYKVLEALNVALYAKMQETVSIIDMELPQLSELPEVKEYNNLKSEEKWI